LRFGSLCAYNNNYKSKRATKNVSAFKRQRMIKNGGGCHFQIKETKSEIEGSV